MTLITFASAKGSPGVSHAVSELARLWPREVAVADLDPVGGDLMLTRRDRDGDPLNPDVGLVSLGASLRGGKSADLAAHLQTTNDGTNVLVGVSTPVQVHAIGPVWSHLAQTLRSWSGDVFADVGRFEVGAPTQPVVESADAVVFVVRDDLPSLAHLRDRLHGLVEPLSIGRMGGTSAGVALVGDPRQSRALDDTVRLLASAGIQATGLGIIADDPRTVASWASLSERARRRSLYQRSLVDVASRLQLLIGVAEQAVVVGEG